MIHPSSKYKRLLFFTLVFFWGIILLSDILGSRSLSAIFHKPAADQQGGQFIKPTWNAEVDVSELLHKTRIIGNEDTRRQAFDKNGRPRVMDLNLAKALKAVATIYDLNNGNWVHLGSAVLTESRLVLLTAAHTIDSLYFGQKLDLSGIRIHFPACNQVYSVDKYVTGKGDLQGLAGRDIGLLVLREQPCSAVEPIKLVTRKSVLSRTLIHVGARLIVAGTYTPLAIYEQRMRELGTNSDSASGFNYGYDSKTSTPYFDRCHLQGWKRWNNGSIEQTLIAHDCDTGKGGSGGPIFASVNNNWYLLGVHLGVRSGNNIGLLAFDWTDVLLRELFQSIGESIPDTIFPFGNALPPDVIKFFGNS